MVAETKNQRRRRLAAEETRRREEAKATAFRQEQEKKERERARKAELKARFEKRRAEGPKRPLAQQAATEKRMAAERKPATGKKETVPKTTLGITKPQVSKSELKQSFYKRMLRGAAGAGSSVAAFGGRTAKKAWPHEIPNISLFVFLIVLGVLDIVLKRFFGYQLQISMFISIVLLVIFGFVVRRIKFYLVLVLVAFGIDVFAAQLPLHLFPAIGLREFLIGIKVFIWLIVGIVLFVLEFVEYLEKGQKVPIFADLIIIALIGIGIFFAFPQLNNVYKHQSQVHSDEFGLAQEAGEKVVEAFKAQVPAWQEVYLRASCSISSPTDADACVKQKTAETVCKPFKEKGETEYQECIKAELSPRALVGGGIHPALREPLKISWEQGDVFKQAEYYVTGTPSFKAKLKIENPRKEQLNLEVECLFVDAVGKKSDSGAVFSTLGDKFIVSDSKKEIEVVCSPQQVLEDNKKYKVIYKVKLVDFTTESWLQVLFIGGDKTTQDKGRIRSDYPQAGASDSANDLARLNFDIGDQPYIEDIPTIVLEASIQNTGGGEIVDVQKAEIDLAPPGIASGELTTFAPCSLLQTKPNTLSINPFTILNQKGQKKIYGGLCFLLVGADLQNPDEYVKSVTFTADLTYAYEVKGEFTTPLIKVISPPTS